MSIKLSFIRTNTETIEETEQSKHEAEIEKTAIKLGNRRKQSQNGMIRSYRYYKRPNDNKEH